MQKKIKPLTKKDPMKQTHFLISTLLLVATLFPSNGFAQDCVHLKTLTGHTESVYSVTFSPDNSTLASTSWWDTTIHLWDVATGKHKKILIGHETDQLRVTIEITCVSFSPDGQILASGSSDKTIRLWDVATGKHLILIEHIDEVNSISFSPDGQILASGSLDKKTICLWNVGTGKRIRTLTGHKDGIKCVVFSPNGQILASGSSDKTIRLWDVTIGRHLHTLSGHTKEVDSVSFSPNGKTLASGSWDDTIHLWNATTGEHTRTLIGHQGPVSSVAFSPDGQTLASGSVDKTIRLWNIATGRQLHILTGHTGSVISVSFSPDGKTLASGSMDKTIRLWQVSSAQSKNTDTIDLSKYLDLSKPPKPTANQIYKNAIRSVMWIVNPGIGEGSGVLIDKKSKLAVTNAHITSKQNTIDVYFPASDEKGELIKDRNFYLTNGGVLKRLGYYAKGHVVARNEKTDLAIIRLDGLPETAREIDWNFTPPATKAGELVYILGNPAKQDLWRWTLGEFLNDHGDFLHIQSDVFGGNSGGPVLNKQGILIGIVVRSDRHMNAAAIPIRHINQLLSESKVKHSWTR